MADLSLAQRLARLRTWVWVLRPEEESLPSDERIGPNDVVFYVHDGAISALAVGSFAVTIAPRVDYRAESLAGANLLDVDVADTIWRELLATVPSLESAVATLLPTTPPLRALFDTPRFRIRTADYDAIAEAMQLAEMTGRALSDIFVFAGILSHADPKSTNDTGAFILRWLSQQKEKSGVAELLNLELPHDAEVPTPDAAIGAASADDANLVREIIESAESIRAVTTPGGGIRTRHLIAALLSRQQSNAVAPYLDSLDYDVGALRRALLKFVTARDESEEAWRKVLFVTSPFDVASRIAGDVWTYDDALGYRVYAKAIADAILRRKAPAPLTIGIQAPWGQGKTTLMKMIQVRIDPKSKDRAAMPGGSADVEGMIRSTYRNLLNWIEHPTAAPPGPMLKPEKDRVPTVWFNPLYYREATQVWAGLAHAILQQLTEQLPSQVAREEFWARLQLARINVGAVRRDVQRVFATRLMPVALFWTLVLLCFAFVPSGLARFNGFAGSLLAAAGTMWGAWKRFDKDTLDRKFEEYVTEPNYTSQLGLLYLVDHDLDRALELLVGKEPIAVFIDDLDRCDPPTVSQIVLAMNQFLSVTHRPVYFILGMDMEMVAAALQQSQKDVDVAPGSNGSYRRGFGWRFMEKFVQLPFVIPHLDPKTAQRFAREQLRGGAAGATPDAQPVAEEKIAAALDRVKNASDAVEIGQIGRLELGRELTPQQRAQVEEALSERVADLMADPNSDEIQRIVEIAETDLELNPRTIKRYFGLVRVLRNIQLSTGLARNADTDRKIVLRVAHLLMNWPEFAQWLRDHPRMLNAGGEWVASIDEVAKIASSASAFGEWETELAKIFGTEEHVPPYLADVSLYTFIRRIGSDKPSLPDLYAARLF